MEEALAKNPNIRTRTVGALADAVGHAYGLEGDHRAWARMPQGQLQQVIAQAAPRVMAAPPPRVLEAAADPFASPMLASRGTVAMPGAQGGIAVPGGPMNPAQQMDRAFAQPMQRDYSMGDDMPAGIPQGRPPWIIPVIVGVVALFLGGGLAIVFALAR
jgi:serine/threonine-protein kinase